MRIIIAAVLVALFAVVLAAESDRSINSWIQKGKEGVAQYKKIKSKIQSAKKAFATESDAEFFKKIGKLVKKVAPIVKKGFEIYGKVKGMGILADERAFNKLVKKAKGFAPKAREGAEKAKKFYGKFQKVRKALKAETESDAEFFSKVKKWWDTKGKNLFNKAKEYYAKGKQIYDIVKPKKAAAESESDAEFLSKMKKWWDTKGKNLFNKAKEYYAKGKQIYDIVKPKKAAAESESDAEFLSKMKKWWDTKGKNLFNKAKGKQIYDIVKPKKAAAESESDAEFLSKMKKWWDTKGKNLFNKAKEYYAKGKQIYDIVKPKKAAEAEAEADTDATFDCGMAYQSGSPLGNKQCVSVQGKPVVVETAVAFEKLNAAAAAAGIKLQVNSGFRTQKEQEYLYNCYKTKKCNNGNLAARPGTSNHQNGKAMDISCSNPKVFDWMRNNASKFGFVRTVASENWHWEFRAGDKCNKHVSYTCK